MQKDSQPDIDEIYAESIDDINLVKVDKENRYVEKGYSYIKSKREVDREVLVIE
jgi:hypothetical protein